MKKNIKITLILIAITIALLLTYNSFNNKPDNNEISDQPGEFQQVPSKKPIIRDEIPIQPRSPIDYSLRAAPLERGEDGKFYVTDAHDITVIVNRRRNLPKGYEPKNLVEAQVKSYLGSTYRLERSAEKALRELFSAAKEDGHELVLISGYRSYDSQQRLYNEFLKNQGQEYVDKFVAFPGQSEHHTGLAVDISAEHLGEDIGQEFGQTPEGKWLADNSSRFGYILRYPKDKENITGYSYEPWHLRYVGKDLAGKIKGSKLTMEEFFGLTWYNIP